MRDVLLGCILVAGGLAAAEPAPPPPPEIALWVRADDLADGHQDGDRIGRWRDAGDAGRVLVADGDRRPVFRAAPPGGHAEVVFAGEPGWVNHAFDLPLAGEWRGMTLFVVGRAIDRPGLIDTAPGANGCLRSMGWFQLCGTEANLPQTFPGIGDPASLHLGTIGIGIDAGNVLSVTTWVDGRQQAASQSREPLYGVVFATPRIGNNNGGEAVFKGAVSELLIYRGLLADAQRQLVERYLLARHGLAEIAAAPSVPVGYAPPRQAGERAPPPPVQGGPAADGLLVWARADDLGGLADGAPVESWPNAAGDRQPLTAAAPANRPGYVARACGDRPALRFAGNGSADPKIVHALRLPLAGDYRELSVLVAGRNLGSGGLFDSAPGQARCLRSMGFIQLCGSSLSSDQPFPVFAHQSGVQIAELTVGRLGEQGQYLETWGNGHRQVRVEDPAGTVAVRFANGAIGSNNAGEVCFSGDIAELLIYDHALSEAERRQGQAYLSGKYGVPIKSAQRLARDAAARSPYTLTQPHLPAVQSWFGNSFSGKEAWVQSGISGINVLPDGTVVATSVWDEPHKEIGFYKDGQVVGPAISGGCSQVVFDDQYFYVGQSGMGKPTAGVRRHARDGKEAPWPGLKEAKWPSFATAGA